MENLGKEILRHEQKGNLPKRTFDVIKKNCCFMFQRFAKINRTREEEHSRYTRAVSSTDAIPARIRDLADEQRRLPANVRRCLSIFLSRMCRRGNDRRASLFEDEHGMGERCKRTFPGF